MLKAWLQTSLLLVGIVLVVKTNEKARQMDSFV